MTKNIFRIKLQTRDEKVGGKKGAKGIFSAGLGAGVFGTQHRKLTREGQERLIPQSPCAGYHASTPIKNWHNTSARRAKVETHFAGQILGQGYYG